MGKRIWMLLISMMLVLGFSLNVYASESSSTITIETQEKHEENILRLQETICDKMEEMTTSISPYAVAHCERYATHDMLSRGWGSIYKSDGTCVVYMGTCHQCTRCNLVFISEGEPLSMPLGYWATWDADSAVTNVTFLTTDNIHYTDSKTIEGMSFRY